MRLRRLQPQRRPRHGTGAVRPSGDEGVGDGRMEGARHGRGLDPTIWEFRNPTDWEVELPGPRASRCGRRSESVRGGSSQGQGDKINSTAAKGLMHAGGSQGQRMEPPRAALCTLPRLGLGTLGTLAGGRGRVKASACAASALADACSPPAGAPRL
jgi:hypothetical protein